VRWHRRRPRRRRDRSAFRIFFPAADNGTRTTLALPYVMGLAKGAPNADNGRKLMTFLLSAPVQQTVAADALGVAVRTGLPADDAANAIAQSLHGVRIVQPDWNAVLRDLSGDLPAYQKATGQ
jgi:2-aminoethylphosphonate transport system substrate-binding protein